MYRYAKINSMDISNGEGIGVAVFVQGCHAHCPQCFNPETWDFNGGKEWNKEIEKEFIECISKPYIKRVSILGGEPLADENVDFTTWLIALILKTAITTKKDIKIWLYTGYTFEDICTKYNINQSNHKRYNCISVCDYIVDGRFEIDKQDLTYSKVRFAGSTNQRMIDMQKTLEKGEIVLYE